MNIDPQWMWIGLAATVVVLIAAAALARRARRAHEARLEDFAVTTAAQQAQPLAAMEQDPVMVAAPTPVAPEVPRYSEELRGTAVDDDLGTIVARPARAASTPAPRKDIEKAIPTENELDEAFDRITLNGSTRTPASDADIRR